ncbi:uncharacterized protein LOC122672518 [Telopea speciosissima]|uniref:uncharacterized protein LOC122672518 n=1 Tax=Telopea speciosissima TaxID=54955 RepID=UPI001CC451AB|nr:uncharacterized protein LOC122672518 [Telopea speciosissima]
MQLVPCKLATVSNHLKRWNKDVFGHVDHLKSNLFFMTHLLSDSPNPDFDLLKTLCKQADWIFAAEETFWLQKARHLYIKDGDRNTKFYHTITKSNLRRRRINFIFDSEGDKFDDPKDMAKVFATNLHDLFTTVNPLDPTFVECLFPPLPDLGDCSSLVSSPSLDEVKQVVFSIGPLKAPGMDGFSASFYQKC